MLPIFFFVLWSCWTSTIRVPNYEENTIKYKTSGSNYCLTLECNFKQKKAMRPYTFGIEDLIESLENALKKCKLTCGENARKQLKDKLIMIKDEIKNLQVIGQNVEDSLISDSDILTHENIEAEKNFI